MASARVAVVGGGLAGLAAARSVAGHGHQVVLFERGERPGGRAASAHEKSFRYEPGAHAVSSTDRHLLELVEGTGLGSELLPLRALALEQAERGGPVPIDASGLRSLARIPGVRWRDALRVARLERLLLRYRSGPDPDAPEGAAAQDDRSVGDFARLYFGTSILEGWLAPWLRETALHDAEEASRVLALWLLRSRRLAWSGSLRGALARLPEALAQAADSRLACEVVAVEPGGPGRLRVHHGSAAGEASTEADAVVMALPAPEALAICGAVASRAEQDFLGQTRYAASLGLAVGLEAPLVRHNTRVRIPSRLGWPLSVIALERGVSGARIPEGRGLAVLLAGPCGPRELQEEDEAVASRLIPYLERLYPGAASRVSWTRASRHPRALPCFPVGRYRAIGRMRRVEQDWRGRGRRLYFAGDYLVGPSLEGAVASGLRAASAVLRDLQP